MAIVIIIAGVIVRLIGVVRPILGNFATKGIAYAMIAKNFVTDPGTVLYPTFNILINGKPSLHMTEWPFYAYVVGVIQKILPWGNVDITGRAVSVAFFAISAWFFFLFCRKLYDKTIAIYALLFYMFFPMGIIYGQSVQLEASMMCCITVVLYNALMWSEGNRPVIRAFWVWLFTSLLILMKIQLLCLAIPVLAVFLFSEAGRKVLKRPFVYVVALACLVLPVLWYYHTIVVAKNYDNVTFSLLYTLKQRSFPDPRLFQVDFYLQIIRILVKEAFSPVGALLAFIGVFAITRETFRRKAYVFAYIAAMVLYTIALPRKMYEMNYYYVPLLVPGAVLCAYGLSILKRRWISYSLAGLFLVGSIAIAYNPSFKTPEKEVDFIEVSNRVKDIIPDDSTIIIASDGHSMAFLYYTGHDGWTLNPKEKPPLGDDEISMRKELKIEYETDPVKLLEKYRGEGAGYFVCDKVAYLKKKNYYLYEYLRKNYAVLSEDTPFIVDLNKEQ